MAAQMHLGRRSTLDPRLAEAVRSSLDPGRAEIAITAELLEAHNPSFVGRISDEIRSVLDEALYRKLGWRALQNPSEALRFVAEETINSKLLALVLSTSGRGYVREAAVQRVEVIPGAFSLALLVNRLNDWVSNVRRAAETRLSEMSGRLDPDVVGNCIEFLWHFDDYGRASSAGRHIVAALIEDERVRARVRDRIQRQSDDRVVRLVQQLMRSPGLDDLLVTLATQHQHPHVRAIATKAALEGVFSWRIRAIQKRSVDVPIDRVTLARSLLEDRSVDVQYQALQHLSQNLVDDAALETMLKRYLTHPRQKLSDLAQWRLNKLGVDWLGWLRQEFDAKPFNAALARVLGRVGVAADGERLWASAQRVPDDARLAFLLAAARLKQVDAIKAVEEVALIDPDVARSRSAAAALLDAQALIPARELVKAAIDPETFARRGLLAHVRRQAIVDQIRIFCRLEVAGRAPDGNEFARLTRRLNRGKFDLTQAEREELAELSLGCPRIAGWMRRLQLTMNGRA